MPPTMRETFRHHHRPNDEERTQLWSNCIFVFDTNTLLNIYRYNNNTRDDFFKILTKLKGRFWIPYNVGVEFYRNRMDVILDQKKKFDELNKQLCSIMEILKDGNFTKSSFLKIDEIENAIKPGIDSARKLIEKQKQCHPELVLQDQYLEELSIIIGDSIGSEPPKDETEKILSTAEERINKLIPPGYMDAKKPAPQKYGDIFIWLEMLDHAKKNQKPMVLITDDDKEDWWHKIEGKKLGPRPELRKEMQHHAGVDFNIYNPSYLLENANKEFQIDVTTTSIEDAKSVSMELNSITHSQSKADISLAELIKGERQSINTSIQQINQFSGLSKQAVLHWLPIEFPNSIIRVSHNSGFMDFTVETDSTLIGIHTKTFHNYNPMAVRSRLRELNLRAFHAVSKNEIEDFLPIIVLENIEIAMQMKAVYNSTIPIEPYYPPIFGVVNNLGIFERV